MVHAGYNAPSLILRVLLWKGRMNNLLGNEAAPNSALTASLGE